MPPPPTQRLYLEDDHCLTAEATVVAIGDDGLAFDRTCFYPGGGGQPSDTGNAAFANGEVLEIVSIRVDGDDVLWHVCGTAPSPQLVGQRAHLHVDRERRLALARYHTVLHVLNTIALRDYGGWITGVQIGADYSRIDFKLENFSPALCAELEQKVNAVLAGDHALKAYYVSEEEFRRRDDLLRTLEVRPPVVGGRIALSRIAGSMRWLAARTLAVPPTSVASRSFAPRTRARSTSGCTSVSTTTRSPEPARLLPWVDGAQAFFGHLAHTVQPASRPGELDGENAQSGGDHDERRAGRDQKHDTDQEHGGSDDEHCDATGDAVRSAGHPPRPVRERFQGHRHVLFG
jgi:misacylated tRNA(Ala) deacylase